VIGRTGRNAAAVSPDAVGHARVQVDMTVERGAEAVQEGDAAEPRAAGSRHVGIRGEPPDAASRSLSISVRKIFVSAATAAGRSASMPRKRFGTEITHCRTGTGGMT